MHERGLPRRQIGRKSSRCTGNRAVALAMAFGPAAGLEVVDALTSEPSLESYHLLPSVRGDLLNKLGRMDEARVEFERAAGLTRNTRERDLLIERARACAEGKEHPDPQ
jgi:predicted RNA polymerase sigma factor